MPPAPKPRFDTLTTAGRLAKAAYEHEQKISPAPTSPATTSPPPKKKKKKTTVLPPPAELEAEVLLRAQAKADAKNKKKAKKPLTTKDKIAASAASRKKKQAAVSAENDGKGSADVGGKATRTKGGSSTAKGEKPKNLMDIMRDLGQMNSVASTSVGSAASGKVQTVAGSGRGGDRKIKTKARESVLVRPTERTKRMKQSQLHQVATRSKSPPVTIKREGDNDALPSAQGSLMDLPLEIRQRIWHLAVVETQFFVYPAIDQEQPDLAMTSRQVRSEVLPLFYGENTFAVEIPASASVETGKKKARGAERVSLEPVKKWMAAMAGKTYVQTIGTWAFSWAPPPADVGTGIGEPGDREVIVSIRYPKPASASVQDVQPEVEIHRQAFCLLESHKLFRPCFCRCYPRWLDDAAATAVLAGGYDRGQQIMLIAKDVEKRGSELVGSRCGDEIVELG